VRRALTESDAANRRARLYAMPVACLVWIAVLVTGCGGAPAPADLSPDGGDNCAFCRMAVSNPRTAGQIVVAGEEPRFFDDLGCLRDYLRDHPLPEDGHAYVADHRGAGWVPADRAVYARVSRIETPMGSHLLAWADESSRAGDPSSDGGEPVPAEVVLARHAGGPR
jgi:copper chaperone NosL